MFFQGNLLFFPSGITGVGIIRAKFSFSTINMGEVFSRLRFRISDPLRDFFFIHCEGFSLKPSGRAKKKTSSKSIYSIGEVSHGMRDEQVKTQMAHYLLHPSAVILII